MEHVPDYICGGIDSAPAGKTWKTIVWGTGPWFKKTMLLSGTGCVNLYEIIKKSWKKFIRNYIIFINVNKKDI